jgi:hypothetical protein
MNFIKKTILVLSLGLLCSSLFSQEIPEDIEKALKLGNATELAKHFNTNIELVVGKNEDVYSKSQAQVILKDFFVNHKPTAFKIIHKGGDKAKFVIGSLETETNKYRVYFFLKDKDGSALIHKLRIEEDNE